MSRQRFDLGGKTVLVTGATGHLGAAMARALAEAGAHVYVNGRAEDACERLACALRQGGLRATGACFDVVDAEQVGTFMERTIGSGTLDVLVNNAYGGAGGTIETATEADYRSAYEITVVAAERLLRAALPALRRAVRTGGDASVINVASMYGVVSPDLSVYATPQSSNPPFYGAAKAALLQFTRYAACQFGSEGLRVNAIAPGPFPSQRVVDGDPAFVERLARRVPLARIGRATEIGGPVVFLASEAASYINGAVLPVDGGWTSW